MAKSHRHRMFWLLTTVAVSLLLVAAITVQAQQGPQRPGTPAGGDAEQAATDEPDPPRPARQRENRENSAERESRRPSATLVSATNAVLRTDAAEQFEVELFFDDMESGAGNWSASGLWHPITDAHPSGWGNSYSPVTSWWYGQNSTGDFDTGLTNSGYLTTSNPISLPIFLARAGLSFQSWEQTECGDGTCPYDVREVEVATDPNAPVWSSLWRSDVDATVEDVWHAKELDLTPYIGNEILLRFGFDTRDSIANDRRGWYVDDVAVGYDPLSLDPPTQAGRGTVGTTVVYSLTLGNSTGQMDSFDVTSSGNVWPTRLSLANTGAISVGGSISITVEVDVPAGVTPGTTDAVTVAAASVSSPGVYSNTATLSTLALSGRFGYVFSGDADEIRLVDTVIHTDAGQSIDTSPYGDDPERGELSPDGGWLYAAMRGSDNVLVISRTHLLSVTAIPVGDSPHSIAFAGGGTYALVSNENSDDVSVIDTAGLTVTKTITVGDRPGGVAASACLDKVYVANRSGNSVSVIDVNTLAVIETIYGLDGPWDVVISPYGNVAYVSNSNDGSIGVIDTYRDRLVATWEVGGEPLALDLAPGGRRLYVTDDTGGGVRVVDVVSGQMIAQIPMPDGSDLEVFPAGAGSFAYVSHDSDDAVSVIDIDTDTLVGTIPNADGSSGLALFPPATTCRQGIVMLLPGGAGYAAPGTTATYTQTVYNLTGAPASFDVATTGNTWPTTLSTNSTGVIPHASSVDVTVQVAVPPGVPLRSMDVVTVGVRSATDPLVRTSTTVKTTAVSGQVGYVFDNQKNRIQLVDTVLHLPRGAIGTLPYGEGPLRGALSPDGGSLYVGLENSSRVLVVDTASNSPVMSLTVGSGPHGIAFSNNGAYAFVANQGDDTITVIDTSGPSVATDIPVGARPLSVASSVCLDKVYVTNRDDGVVSVLDSATLTVTRVISGFDYPWDIVISPYGHVAYVSNQGASGNPGSPSIGVVDTLNDRLIATWPVSGEWIAGIDLAPDGETLYVADANTGRTYAIDTANGEVIATVPTSPYEQTTWEAEVFPAAAGALAYVSNPWDGEVKVIDTDSHAVVGMIQLEGEPRGMALFPPESTCRSGIVAIEPGADSRVAQPGASVVFTATVVNLTGAADSFDLVVSGNTWPATASTANTGAIPHRSSVTVTLEIDVPPGAAGTMDSATLSVTSVSDPGAYADSAEFTVKALSGQLGYVFDRESDEIRLVDTVLHADVGQPIDTSPYGDAPRRGELSPDGAWLYAAMRDSDNVLVISRTNPLSVTAIPVGDRPHSIAFGGGGAYAFVSNQDSDEVSVIDTTSLTVATTITVGDEPLGVASIACLDKIYVANRLDDTVSVIDVATLSVSDVISGFVEPWDVVISPYGHFAYVGNYGGSSIGVIDTTNDVLIATWDIGADPVGLDLSPDGTRLYVADRSGGGVRVVDAFQGEVIARIPTPDSWDLELFPAGAGAFAYVSHQFASSVSVIDTDTDTVVGQIRQPAGPFGLALFPPETACLSGVVLAPDGVTGFGQPGATKIYTETVFNLTGTAVGFDLATSGNTWPTMLSMNNTGVVPDGGSVSFTVQVDLPSAAVAGAADVVTVTATSVGATTLSDAAILTTKALSDQQGYVFDNEERKIHVVDTVLHAEVGSIDTSPFGGGTLRGALGPDGSRLYAGMQDADRVLIVDTSSNSPVTHLPVGDGPHGIAFGSDGAYAFVANQWDDTVSVIDTSGPAVVMTIPVNTRPLSVASSACFDKVYVTNRDASTVSVIDAATLTVTHVIRGFDYPWDVVIAPLGDRAYVSNQGNAFNRGRGSIAVIDTASDTLITTWPMDGKWITGLDLSPDGRWLYVVDANDGFTHVLDTASGETVAYIPTALGEGNSWAVELLPPASGPLAYVANPWDGDVSVVDTSTDNVVGSIFLGGEPRGLALNPTNALCGVAAMAGFTPSTAEVLVDEPVGFANQSVGTPPLAYEWDFGDGSPLSTAENPTHAYTSEGTYTVTLEATNIFASDVAVGTVSVTQPRLYLPLVVRRYP